MYHARPKPGQSRYISEKQAAAAQQGDLFCRDCGQHCEKKRAIKSYRQSLKCPQCGGLLERRLPSVNGQRPPAPESNGQSENSV